MENAKVYQLNRNRIAASHPVPMVAVTSSAPKLKLLDQVRQVIRIRHYSYMTEKAYVGWIKRFVFFHNKRHPAEMGEAEIGRFLQALRPNLMLVPRLRTKLSTHFYFFTKKSYISRSGLSTE